MGRKSKRPKKIVILILLGVMILISLINRFKKKLGILLKGSKKWKKEKKN